MNHSMYPNAIARIQGGGAFPLLHGFVNFFQRKDGMLVEAEIFGLPRSETGFFGFHIHEGEDCFGDDFPNTGSHFNPSLAMHPMHAGDLPPLLADHGKAYMKVLTDRVHVGEIIGRTVVIHSDRDDFHTQPSGDAGSKIACGVIQRV